MTSDKQIARINEVVGYLNDLSECAGKTKGLALVIRSTEKRHRKMDIDHVCNELKNIADEISANIVLIRYNLFPMPETQSED